MRALISKALTGSMVAGAALLVVACGDTNTTNVDNTTVVDLNTTDPMLDGTMTDNMTIVDGAMGNDMMLMNDTLSNDMMANDTLGNAL